MRFGFALALILLVGAPTAYAGPFHSGPHRFGGHHGRFDGPPRSFECGWLDTERAQSWFENIFEDIQEDYDDGLESIEDYYTSDDYLEVVDRTECLVDRYGFFLSGVERSIDRIDDWLVNANDDLTYLNQLLEDYQADEDLSEKRLERIEDCITRITDCLTDKIDCLTEKQTVMSENLPTYQDFNTEITTYLDTIVAAAGGTTNDTTATLAAISVVPEPQSVLLLAFALAWIAARRSA